MAQQANRFTLDEFQTSITAPSTSVQVQGTVDTRLAEQTRSRGFNSLAGSIESLAQKKLAQKIHNDTLDAQLASAYNKEQPGGLEPEAMWAYTKAEDLKTIAIVNQNIKNFATIEGAAILSDSRLSRKEKLESINSGMMGIVNRGKHGLAPVNAAELFPLMEAEYHKFSGLAATDLAKQKKAEDASTNAAAITTSVDSHFDSLATAHADRVSGKETIVEDDDLNPSQYAFVHRNMMSTFIAKGLNVKTVNSIVKGISDTKRGADNREIKATVLTAIANKMLKNARENPAIADPEILTKLIDQMKGNPQSNGSTLRSEINGGTEYGEIFKALENGYRTHLTTIQTNKRTTQNANIKDRDNQTGSALFDSPENFTYEEGLTHLKAMVDYKSQIAAEKRWKAMHADTKLSGSTSIAYRDAMLTADSVLTSDGKKIDENAFNEHMIEYGLTPEAATKLRAAVDPVSKAAKHRTSVLDNETVILLKSQFRPAVKGYLLNKGMSELVKAYFSDSDNKSKPPSALILNGIRKKFGDGQVYNSAARILNAELQFSRDLEALIEANPDLGPREIADLATVVHEKLFKDVITGQKAGDTAQGIIDAAEAEALSKERVSVQMERLQEEGTFGTHDLSATGATTFETPEEDLNEINKKKRAALNTYLKDVEDPLVAKEYIKQAAAQYEQERKMVEANHKITGVIPATRGERISLIIKGTGTGISGIPTGQDRDRGVSEVSLAAFATNPEIALVLRAKALQTASEKEREELSKNVFLFRTDAEMDKNFEEGKNLLRIGSFQFTTDDLKGLTMDNTKDLFGNVGFWLNQFRVFRGEQPNRPGEEFSSDEVVVPPEPEKEEETSIVKEAVKTINSVLEALSTDAGASELGAEIYNASSEEEQKIWEDNAEKGLARYRANELNKKEQFNVTQLRTTLSKSKNSFKNDLKVVGLSFDKFADLMVGVYAAETAFGTSNKVSSTGVVGELQVTRGTFKDTSKPRGTFGPLMAKAAGFKSIEEVRALTDSQLRSKLLNDNKFNYLAGAAVMLSKLQIQLKKKNK